MRFNIGVDCSFSVAFTEQFKKLETLKPYQFYPQTSQFKELGSANFKKQLVTEICTGLIYDKVTLKFVLDLLDSCFQMSDIQNNTDTD